jgi:hypothetical protein
MHRAPPTMHSRRIPHARDMRTAPLSMVAPARAITAAPPWPALLTNVALAGVNSMGSQELPQAQHLLLQEVHALLLLGAEALLRAPVLILGGLRTALALVLAAAAPRCAAAAGSHSAAVALTPSVAVRVAARGVRLRQSLQRRESARGQRPAGEGPRQQGHLVQHLRRHRLAVGEGQREGGNEVLCGQGQPGQSQVARGSCVAKGRARRRRRGHWAGQASGGKRWRRAGA